MATNSHRDIAVAAAKEGKHILCEKPMAMNLDEAKEMLQAAENSGVKHMIGFNYRRLPAIVLARNLIKGGRLGKIYHFRAVYFQDWIIDPHFPLVWRLRKEIAGLGALGAFETTRFAAGRKNYECIEVNGEKGSLSFNLERLNELKIFSAEDEESTPGFKTILVTESSHPYIKAWWPPGHIIGWEHALVHQIHDLLNSIASDRMPTPNFADGLKCQQVLEALVESAEQKKWINIP